MTLVDRFLNRADDNGTVSWFEAVRFVASHDAHCLEEMFREYVDMVGQRVDAGELAMWMGY